MRNRAFLLLGTVLTLLGAVVLVVVMTQGLGPPGRDNLPQLEQPAEEYRPSLVWAITAGLSLAAGAAFILVGMNRWRQPSARR